MEAIRDQYQQIIAQMTGLPVGFLRQAWKGDYSPKKHFFQCGKNGTFECRWVHDVTLMEKMTMAYLLWHSVPDGLKQEFWKAMFASYLQTPEFAEAPMPFRVWLFLKRFPIPPYDLQSILSETGIPLKRRDALTARDIWDTLSRVSSTSAHLDRVLSTSTSCDDRNSDVCANGTTIIHM